MGQIAVYVFDQHAANDLYEEKRKIEKKCIGWVLVDLVIFHVFSNGSRRHSNAHSTDTYEQGIDEVQGYDCDKQSDQRFHRLISEQ